MVRNFFGSSQTLVTSEMGRHVYVDTLREARLSPPTAQPSGGNQSQRQTSLLNHIPSSHLQFLQIKKPACHPLIQHKNMILEHTASVETTLFCSFGKSNTQSGLNPYVLYRTPQSLFGILHAYKRTTYIGPLVPALATVVNRYNRYKVSKGARLGEAALRGAVLRTTHRPSGPLYYVGVAPGCGSP